MSTLTTNPQFLTTAQVRQRYGFRDPAAFLEFVRRSGVPFIKLTARKFVFDPVALAAWESARASGEKGGAK